MKAAFAVVFVLLFAFDVSWSLTVYAPAFYQSVSYLIFLSFFLPRGRLQTLWTGHHSRHK